MLKSSIPHRSTGLELLPGQKFDFEIEWIDAVDDDSSAAVEKSQHFSGSCGDKPDQSSARRLTLIPKRSMGKDNYKVTPPVLNPTPATGPSRSDNVFVVSAVAKQCPWNSAKGAPECIVVSQDAPKSPRRKRGGSKKNAEVDPLKGVSEKTYHACGICGKKLHSRHSLRSHVDSFHSLWTCHKCGRQIRGGRALKNHLVKQHSCAPAANAAVFACTSCDKSLTSSTNLRSSQPDSIKHKKSNGLKVQDEQTLYQCPSCFTGQGVKEGIEGQELKSPLQDEPASVQEFEDDFEMETEGGVVKNHHAKKHNRAPLLKAAPIFVCTSCDKSLTSKSNLEAHVRSYHQKHDCPYCGVTVCGRNLHRHLRRFHRDRIPEENLVHCVECDKRLIPSYYRRHVKQFHTAVTCDKCDVIFIGEARYRQHQDDGNCCSSEATLGAFRAKKRASQSSGMKSKSSILPANEKEYKSKVNDDDPNNTQEEHLLQNYNCFTGLDVKEELEGEDSIIEKYVAHLPMINMDAVTQDLVEDFEIEMLNIPEKDVNFNSGWNPGENPIVAEQEEFLGDQQPLGFSPGAANDESGAPDGVARTNPLSINDLFEDRCNYILLLDDETEHQVCEAVASDHCHGRDSAPASGLEASSIFNSLSQSPPYHCDAPFETTIVKEEPVKDEDVSEIHSDQME